MTFRFDEGCLTLSDERKVRQRGEAVEVFCLEASNSPTPPTQPKKRVSKPRLVCAVLRGLRAPRRSDEKRWER